MDTQPTITHTTDGRRRTGTRGPGERPTARLGRRLRTDMGRATATTSQSTTSPASTSPATAASASATVCCGHRWVWHPASSTAPCPPQHLHLHLHRVTPDLVCPTVHINTPPGQVAAVSRWRGWCRGSSAPPSPARRAATRPASSARPWPGSSAGPSPGSTAPPCPSNSAQVTQANIFGQVPNIFPAVPREHCHDVPKQYCQAVPRQQCAAVPRQACQSVPRQKCGGG